ncbi:pseudouridylate synthase RPUSD2-like [Ylistrum balloti]|uniref:pseudouridylate synthase RPUSD2-like n=1 Tax=Ylistrum balloti TaxID=509963 RepID=UPI002905F647|nr:pseudouridylate synthase RPUSD2-like [Ylistrum balloti]
MNLMFQKNLKSFKNKIPFGNFCFRDFSLSHVIKSNSVMTSSGKSKVDTDDTEMEEESKVEPIASRLEIDTHEVNLNNTNKSSGSKKCQNEADGMLPHLTGLSKRALKRMKRNAINKERRKAARVTSLTKNLNPGFSSDYFGLTDYYYENGLRKVYPYYYRFESYVKERWIGKTLPDILAEFQVDPQERSKSVEDILRDGDLMINGEVITTADRILKSNDFISNRIHRHENPVTGKPLEIVADDENVIVLNKPSSIPVHPCGRYRFNSIPFILGKDLGYANLRSVIECDQPLGVLSRKDSLYGVVPEGKASKTIFEYISYNGTSSLIRCLPQTGRTHQIRLHLQYLGFPVKNDPLYNKGCFGPNNAKGGILEKSLTEIVKSFREKHNTGLWVEGDNPLFQKRLDEIKVQIEQKDVKHQEEAQSSHGHNEACESNPCQTKACELNQKEISSSSQCGKKASNSSVCETDVSDSPVLPISVLPEEEPKAKRCKLVDSNSDVDSLTESITTDQCRQKVRTYMKPEFNPQQWVPDEKCFYCRKSFMDPKPSDMIMYLHALKYKGPKWEYETPLPDWARDDWVEPM